MNALSIPIIMMAGILIYTGFYYLFIYYRRHFKHREDLTFALTSLAMGMYDIVSFYEYNSSSIAEGTYYLRVQAAILCLIGAAFVWFVMDYLELKLKRTRNFFSVFFLFYAIFIFIDRSPLTFDTTQSHIKKVMFPFFNLEATYYEVASGPFIDIIGLIGGLFFLYILFISVRRYWQKGGFRTGLLSISLVIFLAGLCNDLAVVIGLYQFIYVIEYAFIGIVVLMAYSLSDTLVESSIVKEKLIREQYLMNALLNTVTDHIYFKDKESRFVRINKSLANWFGIKSSEEAIGKTDFDFFSKGHARQAYDDEQKIIRTGKQVEGIEEKETWPDGHETWVSTTKMPLLNEEKNIIGTFGISRDITERKQFEEKIKKANKMLQSANEGLEKANKEIETQRNFLAQTAKELEISNEALSRSNEELQQFAYVASHDLQEPLRMISSYLSLIGRRYTDKLDKDGKEFIEYAVDGAKRLQVMINDLLQYSRVSTQGKPFEKTNMEEVLEKVLLNLKIAVEESGGEITHAKLPEIMADKVQMERLLQNLLGNAVKYRGERKPKVHVSVKRKKGEYEFSVQDNGIGIEEEYREKIFGIFQRLHTREEYPGTGIGLAICKKIVERHGGRIWVGGKFNEGSTFYFTVSF